MILGGDEWMRTQYGNNNSYTTWSDNEWNWHRWGEWQSASSPHRHRMNDFVTKLIALRKSKLALFSPMEFGDVSIDWKNSNGDDMSSTDWSGKAVRVRYAAEQEKTALVLINMERDGRNFILPAGNWKRLADTAEWFDTGDLPGEPEGLLSDGERDPYTSHNIDSLGGDVVTGEYWAVGSSIIILEAE